MKKMWKMTIVGIVIIMFAILGIIAYLSQFHIDLSQSYRKVEGFENIVFKDPQNEQCFCLCAWGLTKTEAYKDFQNNRDYDKSSSAYLTLYDKIDIENIHLEQVVLSPDGNYILCVERVYRGTGITDDEDVYYKVYSIKDDTVTTIFSGYKQFLLVDWKKNSRL